MSDNSAFPMQRERESREHRNRSYKRDGLVARRSPRETVYAAIDLGTNNCRMMLAHPTDDGFQVIETFSRIVRLGEGLSATGRLSEAAVERTIRALQICAQRIQRHNVHRIRCIATEACRQAENQSGFLNKVTAETGLNIEPITAKEEAALTIAGCRPLIDRSVQRGLIFDIGGGSTELSWVATDGMSDPEILGFLSIGCGVVNLAEKYTSDPLHPKHFEAIVARIDAELAVFDALHGITADVTAGHVQMLGTSGTVTTLGGVHLCLERYDRSQVDGMIISFEHLFGASALLSAMDCAGRAALPSIGHQRADLVTVGCAVLEAICRRWPVGYLCIADRGIREGLLLAMMADDGKFSN
jgi:exopolyphosphatase/guanosine-5'-triphosphate,3'-diphosphate pyrophosphatase